MKQGFAGKTILVTGGTGSIGSEIVQQLLRLKAGQVRIYSRDEHKQFILGNRLRRFSNVRFILGDIRDKANLRMAMDGVDVVINAAALKHVPNCEFNPLEAVKTNVYGTQNIIEVAVEKKVRRVVTISTDKATTPAGTMGASKLLAEKLMSGANFQFGNRQTRFCSVRFGNVLGSRGSILGVFQDQIRAGGPVSVTAKEMTRFMMLIPEAALLVLKASLLSQGGEIFILKMPVVNLLDLVQAAIDHYAPRFGKKPGSIKIRMIGMRPGERLHETLLTDEEVATTVENKEMFIVLPSLVRTDRYDVSAYGDGARIHHALHSYRSEDTPLLPRGKIGAMLKKYEAELAKTEAFLRG
jgi:FlaA1/EpsC-like NDP-sugar epimerase